MRAFEEKGGGGLKEMHRREKGGRKDISDEER